jgi:hypothetical protein
MCVLRAKVNQAIDRMAFVSPYPSYRTRLSAHTRLAVARVRRSRAQLGETVATLPRAARPRARETLAGSSLVPRIAAAQAKSAKKMGGSEP